ncbi:MAG: peptidase M28, partial [Bryobacteraceae bacterium]
MRLKLVLMLILIGAAVAADTDWAAAGKAWWAHVQFLADDKLEGRNVGSKGYEAAADYVVSQFERAGLSPGAGSTYSQPVGFIKGALDETASSLALVRDGKAVPIALGDDALLGWGSATLPDVEAPLVFAGYGLNIPEAGYSDFKDPALRGAVAVYLQGGPSSISGNLRSHYSSGEERTKAMKAAGVIGAISIPNPRSMEVPWARYKGNRLQARMWLADPALSTAGLGFTATWNPARADQLFEGSGHTIAEILTAADHDRPLPHFPLTVKVRAHVSTSTEKVQSRNVVGLQP